MQALCLPLGASISLLIMFFFFDSMQMLFAICTASKWCHQLSDERLFISIVRSQSSQPSLWPFCCFLCVSTFWGLALTKRSENLVYLESFIYLWFTAFRISFGVCGRFTVAELVSFSLSATIVCIWILTGHWLLMDAMGMGLCVAFIAFVRLPSLKVSTLLLTGLLIYDVFWVFFSSYIFSSNVMVSKHIVWFTANFYLVFRFVWPLKRLIIQLES